MSNIGALPRASFNDKTRRIAWTIVAAKVRSSRNRLIVLRRRSPVLVSFQFGFAVPIAVGFTALLMVGFASGISSVNDDAIARSMLALILACGCIGAFIGSSTTALQAMFLADDIPFLLTLPIPLRALFGSKFLEAAIGVVPAGMLFVAAAGGYGIVESHHVAYWPTAVLVLVGFFALATSCSVAVVSVVTRYIPPRRARLFLFCISLCVMALTLIAWRYVAPQPGSLGEVVNRERYDPIWNALSWTPVGLGTIALNRSADGDILNASLALAALLTITACFIAISFHIFTRTFFRGLAQTKAVQAAEPNASVTSWLMRIAALVPGRIGALVLKEWLLLFRDLRRLSGAIWPIGIVAVYTVLLGRNGGATFGTPEFEFWSKNGSLALMPWGLSLGISVYSYGSEGRNIQLMRSLPFSPARIFLAKTLASMFPVMAISLGAATFALSSRGAPLTSSLQLMGLIAWMVIGYTTIDTAASALAPNFETDQIQRTIGLPGRIFSLIFGGFFSVATLLAASRLVIFAHTEPASLKGVLDVRISSIEPFGWPLVILAVTAAALAVIIAALAAVHRTASHLTEAV